MNRIIKEWIERTIIELNLCPWAQAPYEKGLLEVKTVQSIETIDNYFEDYINTSESQTSLHIIDENISFTQLLNVCDFLADIYLDYSFIAFHPNFLFEKLDKDDKANYVNRSPLPLIHLIKGADIQKALSNKVLAEKLSYNNEHKIKKLNDTQLEYYFGYLKDIK